MNNTDLFLRYQLTPMPPMAALPAFVSTAAKTLGVSFRALLRRIGRRRPARIARVLPKLGFQLNNTRMKLFDYRFKFCNTRIARVNHRYFRS
jgi:hypothetical protein